ncbi:hypothetical protein ACOSQ3_009939 [Xanthoceras sorbifolium]
MKIRPPQGEVAEALTFGRMKVRPPQGEIKGTIEVAQRSEAEKMRLNEDLEAARKEAQAYKEEHAAKTELKKELAKKANRCQALRKKIKLEMNTSSAKYKDQVRMLKDEIERATVNLQYSYDMLERQTGDLTRPEG